MTLSRLEIEVVNSNEILVPDLADETCVRPDLCNFFSEYLH